MTNLKATVVFVDQEWIVLQMDFRPKPNFVWNIVSRLSCIWVILIRTATHMCQAKVQTFYCFELKKSQPKRKYCVTSVVISWYQIYGEEWGSFFIYTLFFVKVLLKIIGCTEKENKHDKRIGFIRSWVLCTLTRNLWLTLTTIWNFDRHHTYHSSKDFLCAFNQT